VGKLKKDFCVLKIRGNHVAVLCADIKNIKEK